MTQTIINSFDLWTGAQGVKSRGRVRSIDNISLEGIARLRELILQLAVSGKLVLQNANDEPASELLKRIEGEKKRLLQKGILKKIEPAIAVKISELPFELPTGWVWTKIRNIGHDWGQKIPADDFTYIDVSAIDNSAGIVAEPTILKANEAPSRARKIVKKGSVIYSTVRPYLKNICVVGENFSPEPIASTAFAIMHPYLDMESRFFFFYLRSPVFIRYVESVQTGIAYPAINDKQFFGGVIPLPPLAEQHRIVAKVDELMALCDKLEASQTASLKTHQTLVKALLLTLTEAKDADSLAAAWQRMAPHFDVLFCTEDSIEQLKQTILQLAIMGRLVQQDPADEPASELIKRIEAEKAKLIKAGKLKKEKPLPEIKDEEKPFELPAGWEWERLGVLLRVLNGRAYKMHEMLSSGMPLLRVGNLFTSNEWYYSNLELEPDKYIASGDLIYAWSASFGPFIWEGGKVIYHYHIWKLDFFEPSSYDKMFMYLYLSSVTQQIKASGNGIAMIHMTKERMEKLLVPTPPLSEQHRIVAKVDELMALCDSLKAKILKAEAVKVQLSKTIVEAAVA